MVIDQRTEQNTDEAGELKLQIPLPTQSIIVFDEEVCTGCVGLREPMCVKGCRTDMLIPNPEKGKPPIVAYPDECCECGCCVHACPRALKGAITMNWPLAKSVRWKRKDSGEHYRIGMANPPEPDSRPPVSGYKPKLKRGQKRASAKS